VLIIILIKASFYKMYYQQNCVEYSLFERRTMVNKELIKIHVFNKDYYLLQLSKMFGFFFDRSSSLVFFKYEIRRVKQLMFLETINLID
jgi:hypothetical protein